MAAKTTLKETTSSSNLNTESKGHLAISYPLVILAAIVAFLYMGSLNFGYTDLDDTIFIKETQAYNEQFSNLLYSFHRGVFSESNDTYYRPLLLNSYVINNALSETDVKGYHAMNLLFHLLSVLLLFVLFKKVGLDKLKSFLLTLLFAVHPVLSQAVVWIPGRNDTILAMFAFGFVICALDYIRTQKTQFLLAQFVFLLAALFTKETAVFVAPACLMLCFALPLFNWKDRKSFVLYGTWVLAIAAWFVIRSMATIKNDPIQLSTLARNFPMRLSLTIQYLGKIFLPFNLSVFPMLNETSYVFGILAVIGLGVLLYVSKARNKAMILAGLSWFMLILFPLFILPSALNDQDFEHRLYLPIVGILLVLSQTALFQNVKERTTSMVVVAIAILFAGINAMHQQQFSNPISFWTGAVKTTPNSAYANMMLAARIHESDPTRGDQLMRNAHQLNPNEKYVNYYLGKVFLEKNNIDSAERYLLAELKGSAYFDTYFLMSRVVLEKGDSLASLNYMQTYLEKDPGNSQAMNNYILLLCQTNQYDRAKTFIRKKQQEQIAVPKALVDLVNGVLPK